jgi:hypothetical protein
MLRASISITGRGITNTDSPRNSPCDPWPWLMDVRVELPCGTSCFLSVAPPDAGDDVMRNYEAAMDPSRAGRRLSRGGTMMTFPLDCAR